MKKLAVFIEDDAREIQFHESLVINKDSFIYVKTVSIFWDYNNVYSGENDTIVYGSTTVKFKPGYWTFDLIKKKIDSLSGNLSITSNLHNSTCTITTDAKLQLKRFGELLGFDNKTTINSGSSKTSKTIDINSKLRYIKINCDAVDRTSNMDINGKRSGTITTLPITTKKSLKGCVCHYW